MSPSKIFLVDGGQYEMDLLFAHGKKEGGLDVKKYLESIRRTITKNTQSDQFLVSDKVFALDTLKELLNESAKGKHLYVLPFHDSFGRYGIKMTDSARITLLDISTYPETGQEVLKNFPDNCFDVIFFSSTVEFLPPMEFVDFTKYKETPATGLRNRFSDRAKVTSRIRHNQPTKD
eukprot:TRINITY_DN1576_c0_g1_i11.p1 TRINITY_DN1576_c0_g1~~TRINITY_DN1576_c0_g1_i11.p1  ORF type:complete len:176 (-),score=22.73 TRINITY_DN1576_c0_g1_i11:124-651(-)